jgi:hypothetical protein
MELSGTMDQLVDPENHQCLMETSLPTPKIARIYVNLPEVNITSSSA